MNHEIRYDAERKCVVCRLNGTVEASELPALGAELVALLAKHECERILNDLRAVAINLSTLDIYDIPELARSIGLSPRVKRAVVFSRDETNAEFFETVSRNQGQNVRAFTDVDEAFEWLTSEKPVRNKESRTRFDAM